MRYCGEFLGRRARRTHLEQEQPRRAALGELKIDWTKSRWLRLWALNQGQQAVLDVPSGEQDTGRQRGEPMSW